MTASPQLPNLMLRSATIDEILEIRRRVLREGMPDLTASFDGDDHPDTRHFAAFQGTEAKACLTVLVSAWEGEPAFQLRGMAVDRSLQKTGIGKALLLFAIEEMKKSSGLRLWWCNARVSALAFYEKLGWKVASGEFEIPRIGPHRKMTFSR